MGETTKPTKKKRKEAYLMICDCGISVRGISKEHAISNLKIHIKSKIHREIMKNRDKAVK